MLQNLLQDKKKLFIVIGVVVILIGLAIFIFAPKQKATTVKVNDAKVTLTWWKNFYGQEAYADIIKDFKAQLGMKNVTINVVTKEYNNDYYKSLIADIAANAGPDIFSLRNDDLPAYQKYMTPINTFTGATLADYRNSFVPLAVRDTMVKDKVYGITSYVDNLQLYYNTSLLAQAGIAIPPATWKDLDNQLSLINKRDPKNLAFNRSAISLGIGAMDKNGGGGNVNRYQDIIPAILFQNGTQMYDYQKDVSIFGQNKNATDVTTGLSTTQTFDPKSPDQTNPAYSAVNFYYSFANVNSTRYSWNTESVNNINAFTEGKLAYIIHYSYFQDTIKQMNNRLNYGISELPQLDPNLKKTYGFFFMDGLNRKLQTDVDNAPKDVEKLQKLQVAQQFMYFLSQKSAQEKFVTKTNLPGARKDVINLQLSSSDTIRTFAAGSLYADNYYKPDVARSEKIWGDLYYRVIYENMGLPDSLKLAITEYNSMLQAGPKLRG